MKTYTATPDNLRCNWFVIDATDKVLGRLATKIASYLRGKHKPEFTPHVAGDYIVVINADKLRVTGKKSQDKIYYHHSNYPGGIKAINFEDKMSKNSLSVLEIAVKGMLPKGPLGREMFRRLKVYHGAEHNHQAQQPQLLEWTD